MELKHYYVAIYCDEIILLIVPYGIETRLTDHFQSMQQLLIVPYGIETTYCEHTIDSFYSFNRTLWN